MLIGREAGSGTRDGFESITDTKDACQYRQELTSTGDVINTVSQNPDAIGYASLSAVGDSVKALTVGGVEATEATVKDGSYVVQRPFVLVTKEGTKLSPRHRPSSTTRCPLTRQASSPLPVRSQPTNGTQEPSREAA